MDMTEEHHKVPRYLNGSDDPRNLIRICPTCHTVIHHLTTRLKKSYEDATTFLNANFPGQTTVQDLLIELSRTIIAEEENAPPKDHIHVMWEPDLKTHAKLREMAKQSGSIPKLLEYLIEKEWRERNYGVGKRLRRL
jgi:hypothetical protein